MDLFMAISQGAGVSLATGIRALLPALTLGVLARADAGVDLDGTGYGFLESIPWLALLVVFVGLVAFAERIRAGIPTVALATAAAAIGAGEFAASLADGGYSALAGFPAGAACAGLGFVAAQAFFGRAVTRARARGEEEAASLVELFAQGAALALAVIAVLLSPVAWLAVAFAVWIVVLQRRRASQKYEGLRILR